MKSVLHLEPPCFLEDRRANLASPCFCVLCKGDWRWWVCFLMSCSCVSPAIDCELSEWSQWSECNKSCGKGHMIRTRVIQMEPQFGGAPCPETIQRKKCRVRKCLRNQSIQKLRWREARESRRSEQLREEADGEQFPGIAPRGRAEMGGGGRIQRHGEAVQNKTCPELAPWECKWC